MLSEHFNGDEKQNEQHWANETIWRLDALLCSTHTWRQRATTETSTATTAAHRSVCRKTLQHPVENKEANSSFYLYKLPCVQAYIWSKLLNFNVLPTLSGTWIHQDKKKHCHNVNTYHQNSFRFSNNHNLPSLINRIMVFLDVSPYNSFIFQTSSSSSS